MHAENHGSEAHAAWRERRYVDDQHGLRSSGTRGENDSDGQGAIACGVLLYREMQEDVEWRKSTHAKNRSTMIGANMTRRV